jgi:PRTRC genetic system ThiF family protein
LTVYYLSKPDFPGVLLVGCGGTGGYVAEGLCRLLPRSTELTLVDGDLVEERNLVRQNFYPSDLGRFKSQVLAERLAQVFGRAVGYSVEYLVSNQHRQYRNRYTERILFRRYGLVIGCVDNHLARQALAQFISEAGTGRWWVDAGNSDNWGQVLIGNARGGPPGAFGRHSQLVYRLPAPTVQRPALLLPPPPVEPDLDCAEAVAAGDQSPTINQAMAALVLEVVRRIQLGSCPWISLFLDLDAGSMTPTLATPEVVARITGAKASSLFFRD